MKPEHKISNKFMLILAAVATTSLAACGGGGSSSGGGGGGGGGGGDSFTPTLTAEQREDAVAYYATSVVRDSLELGVDSLDSVLDFSDNFVDPAQGASLTSLQAATVPDISLQADPTCDSGSVNILEDNASRFTASFDQCVLAGFFGGFLIDGDVDILRGEGGSRDLGGNYTWSRLIEIKDYSTAIVGFDFGFSFELDGDIRLDYTNDTDWKLTSNRFDQRFAGSCNDQSFNFAIGIREMEAVSSPSTQGMPMVDMTQNGKLSVSGWGAEASGEYTITTLQTVTYADAFTDEPESGRIRITGAGGFDITVTYELTGYWIAGSTGNRFELWDNDDDFDEDDDDDDDFDFICTSS